MANQAIMRDKWMNIGYEDEELKPHIEPQRDIADPHRIGTVINNGGRHHFSLPVKAVPLP